MLRRVFDIDFGFIFGVLGHLGALDVSSYGYLRQFTEWYTREDTLRR